ncbi:hypothetical protein A0U95_28000 [Pseudomonas brassicacearum]|nr:hypothetical protein A0U95_28000 [Pseudomonas brassicacearum]
MRYGYTIALAINEPRNLWPYATLNEFGVSKVWEFMEVKTANKCGHPRGTYLKRGDITVTPELEAITPNPAQ